MKVYLMFIIFFLSTNGVLAQGQARAHRHRLTIDETNDWKDQVKVVEVPAPNRKLKREGWVSNRSFTGFAVYEEGAGYRIFFTDRQTKKTYEIRGVGQPHRPFSDLWWKSQRLLVFDSWSNPHHGAHYEFDAKTKKIKKIRVFRDQR